MYCPFTWTFLPIFLQEDSTFIILVYTFCLTLYPCASIKILVHNIILDTSSTPTKSACVMLFMFSFCFCNPFAITPVYPVCSLKYECIMNVASTYHFRQLYLSAFNVRHKYWVPNIYLISLISLLKISLIGMFHSSA